LGLLDPRAERDGQAIPGFKGVLTIDGEGQRIQPLFGRFPIFAVN
jgi:hypothetical protein